MSILLGDRLFRRNGEWWAFNGDGRPFRLLDAAPTLEREALKDPEHVAGRQRIEVPDPDAPLPSA